MIYNSLSSGMKLTLYPTKAYGWQLGQATGLATRFYKRATQLVCKRFIPYVR